MLARDQQLELLRAARRSIEGYLSYGRRPIIETSDPELVEPAGSFVSLHRVRTADADPQLRGCIGTFEADQPLLDTVGRMAVAAATTDPRFPAVILEELAEIAIEISVLSARHAIAPEEVRVGDHGLHVSRGSRRGVLLPQVASEHGWNRDTFLEQTCRKAGLPADAWRFADTAIEAFTAQVFGEEAHR